MNSLLFNLLETNALIFTPQFFTVKLSGNWDIFRNPTILAMTVMAIVLLVAIALLGNAMIRIKYIVLKDKKGKEDAETQEPAKAFAPVLFFGMVPVNLWHIWAGASESIIQGVSNSVFYFLLGTLFVELAVLLFIIRNISNDVKPYLLKKKKPVASKKRFKLYEWWWKKLNRASDDEEKVDTGHLYDGIRELDNQIPPWWRYAFYGTIAFAVVYLWRYHVVQSAPLQIEEYEIAVAKAEEAHKAYLLAAGNRIDENNVEMTDEAGIESGKKIFQQNCAACHGGNGEGLVGPNLTDQYWVNGEGTIRDIFSVVKYGVVEKGMMAWKDQLSPSMIAQVSSYILTLQGTDPPNAKEPQGQKYDPVVPESVN